MKTIAVIVLWYGKIPGYFPLWTRSLKINTGYDFFLFTDQQIAGQPGTAGLPENLTIVHLPFGKLKELIAETLDIRPALPHTYKLCDFRPAFGEIFASWLKGYRFWGYCDMDLVFGNLSDFVTPEILRSHQKIFSRGHFTLYRNEPAVNRLYRSSATIDARRIFTSPDCFIFDEWHGIHQIFSELQASQFHSECMADIHPNRARYTCSNIENFKKQLFIWEDGHVRQYYLQSGRLHSKELAYIHFQKRKIRLTGPEVLSSPSVILNACSFLPFGGSVTAELVNRYDQPNYLHCIRRGSRVLLKRLSPTGKNPVVINRSLQHVPVRS